MRGLILVSPLCKVPSWTEWFCNKVSYLNFFIIGWKLMNLLPTSAFIFYAGDVKLTLLLWHVWSGKGVIAKAIFQ